MIYIILNYYQIKILFAFLYVCFILYKANLHYFYYLFFYRKRLYIFQKILILFLKSILIIFNYSPKVRETQFMFERFKQKIKDNKYKILAGASFAAAGYLFYCYLFDDKNIKLSSFLSALQNNQLDEVVVKGQQVWFRSFASEWYYSSLGNYPRSELFNELKNASGITFSSQTQIFWPYLIITTVLPTAAMLIMLQKLTNPVKDIPPRKTNTMQKFQHYYGGQKLKESLKETIDFLSNPQKYKQIGIRIRRGILLYGPPGTGKTMLARVIANEAGLPFIASSGSQFQQIFVGVGPKKIRKVFKDARQCQAGCIIFIDELDAIGSRNQFGHNKEHKATINQLLSEIDGFEQNQNIFIIAATNNLKAIDSALLRPGRFDLKFCIPAPNEEQRAGIFQKILNKKKVPHNLENQDFKQIGEITQNYTGAHLQNLINQSLFAALRNDEKQLKISRIIETYQNLIDR